MRRPGVAAIKAIQRHQTAIAVVVVALVFYGYSWAVQPGRPQVAAVRSDPQDVFIVFDAGGDVETPPQFGAERQLQATRLGWYASLYDQFHYGQMARSLARFDLPGTSWDEVAGVPVAGEQFRTDAAAYAYGLGYPILAVPFVWLGFSGDPYVIPNGLLFALSAWLALRIARRFVGEPAAVLVALALIGATPYVRYFVIPFGTSVTVVAVLVATWALVAPRLSRADVALVASSASICAAARYVDGTWPVVLIAAAVVLRRPGAVRTAIVAGLAVAATVAIVAATHELIFGTPWKTPYHFHNGGYDVSDAGYEIRRIPEGFVGAFLSGDRSGAFGVDPIVRAAPWLILAPAGLLVLVRERHPLRWPAVTVAVTAIVAIAQYCAWFFGGADNLYLWNIRFYQPWFPFLTVLAAVTLERALTRWAGRSPASVDAVAPDAVRASATGPGAPG